MSRLRSRRLTALSGGGGGGLPNPPDGYLYVVDSNGAYVIDSNGAYIISAISNAMTLGGAVLTLLGAVLTLGA